MALQKHPWAAASVRDSSRQGGSVRCPAASLQRRTACAPRLVPGASTVATYASSYIPPRPPACRPC